MKIKVMSIFGTRPEASKMCPVVKALEAEPLIDSRVCVTAQHREMLDQVLDVFSIEPNYDLDIMTAGQTLTEITTRALMGIEKVLETERPDLILVHGDTTTTFAGALAGFYHQIKVGHVEAGLRTFDKLVPYPEEMNRLLTGRIADLHFAPTSISEENLLKEGIDASQIFTTGNTAIDALNTTIRETYVFEETLLNGLDYGQKKIIAMTAHRRENLGEPLGEICEAVMEIVAMNQDVEVVYAVHKNPKVREVVFAKLGGHPRIHLIEPLGLTDMHNLLSRAYMVLTDSGGIQEEVPSMGTPVLVLRNSTERPEGVTAGTLKIAGTKKETIVQLANELLTDVSAYQKMALAKNPYGDGKASQRIVESILYTFNLSTKKPEPFKSFVEQVL